MSNVAENIIRKCGGAKRVADWLGIGESVVHRWKYSPEKGGTGGLIPSNRQQSILDRAISEGIDLQPADFFDNAVSEEGADA